MMNLSLPTEPFQVQILDGIAFIVRPITLGEMTVYQARARRLADEVIQSLGICQDAGLTEGWKEFNPEDEDQRAGLYQKHLMMIVAENHITGWEGVKLGAEPAPVNKETIGCIMQDWIIAEKFFREVTRYHRDLSAAKKGSGVALHGSSEKGAAPSTAKAATS